MDTTPSPPPRRSTSRLSSKSASCLSRIDPKDDPIHPLDLTSESPQRSPSEKRPLKELLLLSVSPQKKPKPRLIETAEDPADLVVPRRRCKSRSSPMGLLSCGSPRNNRRSRRRLEQENQEKELGLGDENAKPRKRRQTGRPRKEKLTLVPSSSSSLPPKSGSDDYGSSLDHMMHLISDLIMWNDVAKSTLWFGLGSMCFLSSCFASGLRWSIFSMVSQLGLTFLAVSFFYNSISKRNKDDPKLDFKLKEEDIVRLARVFLPATNLVIAKTREIFSGDPSTTLKVAPFLLFGAEYGHLITLWRLCAVGFFISFTIPRFYFRYSVQISKRVDYLKSWAWEAWGGCTHKKVVAASAITVFWNLSSIKTRIFTAFISAVILRYSRQNSEVEVVEGEDGEQRGTDGEQNQQQALVVV